MEACRLMGSAPTLYVIEKAEGLGKRPVWHPVAKLKARSALDAIKAVGDDEGALYRAVPVAYITEATGAGERFPSLTLT